jgi:Cd2+/Zn2+-exporting ATPase
MTRLDLEVVGMDCAEEVTALRAAVEPLPGVERLDFHLLERRMTVHYAADRVTPATVLRAVARTGLRAQPAGDGNVTRKREESGAFWRRRSRTVLTGLSGLLLLVGFLTHAARDGMATALSGERGVPGLATAMYVVAAVAGAWFVLPRAWSALRRFRPDMSLLMTVAVAGAIGIGEYFEAATVAFLFAVSLALEAWSVGRARQAVATLLALTPPKARVLDAAGERTVDVASVAVGTRIVVKPGEKVPLDGRVVAGRSAVDQSPITGESTPLERGPGDTVFAGSINHDGALEIETAKAASDTVVARIVRLVDEAQARRAPTERWVETFARYYTPAVLAIALVLAGVVPWFAGDWSRWLYEALVLLVIACPCALVISTPVTIVAALTSAARRGVLIKGGEFVELPARLRAVAVDKTGTLTIGRPVVREILSLSEHTPDELLAIASAIEQRSEHPLARAIVAHATERGIVAAPVADFRAEQGKGATAMLAGKPVWLGSHRYLEERGRETPEQHEAAERLAANGSTVVVLGEEHHVCGLIALADEPRSEARAAVQALRDAGIEHVVMLTGDNEATARAIAAECGVTEYRAELLPQQKVDAVGELVEKYGFVAMVGDGINDAPALARATIGVAMGTMGTDAAIETADVALMRDDLTRLAWLIRHSRRALRVIRTNVAASLFVKAAVVLLALTGHASLWVAIAADMGVSLAVVANALRLLRPDRETV